MRRSDAKRILVTSAQWETAMAYVQSYGRLGHQVVLYDPDPKQPLSKSKFCSGFIESPAENSGDTYVDRLLQVLRDGKFDLFVPVSDAVVDTIAGRIDELRQHVRVELASPDKVRNGQDKAKLARFALQHDIRIPHSYFPENLEQARALAEEISYPCVAKLPMGTGSTGVQIVRDARALIAFFEQRGSPDNWPFVQEFIGGDLFDVTAICKHGDVVAFFAFRSPIESQVGGTPPYAFTLHDPELVDATRKVARELGWHGAVDFDFLRNAKGEYLLLELNPRLSGTTNFAYKLGVDLPKAYLDLAFGRLEQSYQRDYREGIMFRTPIPAEIIYWNRSRWPATKEIMRRSAYFPVRTNIYWSDWPLLIRKIRQAAWLVGRQWV